LSIKLYYLPPLTPVSRAASIRAVHTRGSTHDHSWCGAVTSQVSPPRIALSGTATGLSPLVVVIASPSSCTPSLPGITRLHRYSECCDSCLGGVAPAFARTGSCGFWCPLAAHASLLASRIPSSEPSVSNHRPAPMVALAPRPSPGQALTPQRHRPPRPEAGLGFTFASRARYSITPNRVCYPTGDPFASCCSPPRLAAT
jgi:hypothetical protein